MWEELAGQVVHRDHYLIICQPRLSENSLSIYLSIYLCMCVHTTAMRSGIAWWRYRAPVSPADRQLSNRAEDQQFRPVRLGGRHHVRRCRSSRVRRRLSRLLRCTQGTTAVPINRQLLSHFL